MIQWPIALLIRLPPRMREISICSRIHKKSAICKTTYIKGQNRQFFEKNYSMGLNCTCMGRFDTSGTSKNDNFPKVLVGHGVKKYSIEIFLRGLQAEIWLFVYIL